MDISIDSGVDSHLSLFLSRYSRVINRFIRLFTQLRKHLNSDYLDLLRFFLNHRTFRSSRVTERKGKSPRELMIAQKHPHWLEMIGFELFQRA